MIYTFEITLPFESNLLFRVIDLLLFCNAAVCQSSITMQAQTCTLEINQPYPQMRGHFYRERVVGKAQPKSLIVHIHRDPTLSSKSEDPFPVLSTQLRNISTSAGTS